MTTCIESRPSIQVAWNQLPSTCISVSNTIHSVESHVLLEYLPHIHVLISSGPRERMLFDLA